MAERKVQQRTIESREKINQAALTLFSEKGYYNTNTKEIAKLAGVSVGNFYNYYKDKGEAYSTLMRIYLEGSTDAVKQLSESLVTTKNPREMFAEYIHKQMERAASAGDFFRDNDVILRDNEPMQQLFAEAVTRMVDIIEELLRQMDGVVKRASYSVMARLIYTMVNETTQDIISFYGTEMYDEYLTQFILVIQNYMFGEKK